MGQYKRTQLSLRALQIGHNPNVLLMFMPS